MSYDRQNAATAYGQAMTDALRLLKRIETQLGKHEDEFHRNPTNWGYVGDVTSVVERLKEIWQGL